MTNQQTFYTIINQDRVLFEAGLFQQVLKLRLTRFESQFQTSVYVGEIRSLDEDVRIKDDFNCLGQILDHLTSEHLEAHKKLRLIYSKENIFFTLIHFINGNTLYEYITVQLNKVKKQNYRPNQLQNIIDRNASNDSLSQHEIKANFNLLSQELKSLKQHIKKEDFSILKKDSLGKVNQQTNQDQNFELKILNEINAIKSQLEETNDDQVGLKNDLKKEIKKIILEAQERDLSINLLKDNITVHEMNFKDLFKFNEQNKKTISSLKNKIDLLAENVANHSKNLASKTHKMAGMGLQNKNLLQKIEYQTLSVQKLQKKGSLKQGLSKDFKFDGKTLTKLTDSSGQFIQFIFEQSTDLGQQFKFQIKIVSSKKQNVQMLIGVLDYQKQKNQTNSSSSSHAICYYAHTGEIYPEGTASQEFGSINIGSTVQVKVNRTNQTIEWIVEGEHRAVLDISMFGDSLLVPYIQMCHQGDQIEFTMK